MKITPQNRRVRHWISMVPFMLLCFSALAGENWPEFRGPYSDGISPEKNLPLHWSETANIKWKIPIHDHGHSTPVVWGDRIWLTTATKTGHELFAVCCDFNSGKIIHDIKVFDVAEPQRINSLNTYATPTPVIEAGRVYVHYGTFGTACLDTETSETLWQRRDLNCRHLQGPASSAFIFENLLILHLEGTDVQYLAALDKITGKTVWKTERPKELYGDDVIPLYRKAYTTPIVIQVNGKPQLISNGAQVCIAYDPYTGKEIWRVVYGGDSTISRPITGAGLVFINCGYEQPSAQLWAVRPDGRGDVTGTHVVWKVTDHVPTESSPVFIDGLIYLVDDNGTASCLEAATGKTVWQEKIGGRYGASPVYAHGYIYFFNKKGTTTIIKAGRTFQVAAVNELDGGFWASPAVKDRSLIVRTTSHLYRIEKNPGQSYDNK